MAVSETMTLRVRDILKDYKCLEKKMFRGISFMLDDKMLVSVGDNELLVRVLPLEAERYAQGQGVRPMKMRGKELKGWLFIHESKISNREELSRWINRALEYHKHTVKENKSKS